MRRYAASGPSTSLVSHAPSYSRSVECMTRAMSHCAVSTASSAMARMSAPICLIENTKKGKFKVNPKASEILFRNNQPVVVVSIVGLYRTGKSYLMNKLAGAQTGFSLGSTIQAETKGIWMWCVPHPYKENHTLVLLDTEGLGDVEKGDSNNDILLFSLALLLSSALVYNSKGTIDQDAVDKLKFVGEISEYIKVKSGDSDDEELEFSKHFPIFIWAVRDFHLQLIIDGREVSEDEYLENALKLRAPEKSTKDQEYNRVRKQLRSYFGNRKCFVFEQPTSDMKSLQRLDEVPDRELSATFVAQSQNFCDYIFRTASVKTMNVATTVTGRRLGELATMYAEALNNSKFVCMEEAVVSLAEKENKMAVEEAIQYYILNMNNLSLPTETHQQFLNQSKEIEDEAQKIFMQRSFKDENRQFLEECMETIYNKREEFSSINEQTSRAICELLLQDFSSQLDENLAAGVYCIPEGHSYYSQSLDAIKDHYYKQDGKGLEAEKVLQEFLQSRQETEMLVLNMDETLTQREKERQEENARRQMYEAEVKLEQERRNYEMQQMQQANDALQSTVQRMQQQMEEERRTMNNRMEQLIRQKQQEQQECIRQGLQQQASMYQRQINDLQRDRDNRMREIQARMDNDIRRLENQVAEKKKKKKGGCSIS